MRFALLGDHADGLAMARALVDSGRHELVVFCGSALAQQQLPRWGLVARCVGDLEETLADPLVEAVIVADRPTLRPAQLRRALQAERHVLSVVPADQSPDLGYEAGMLQGDTGQALVPLLPETFHPGIAKLAELAHAYRRQGTLRYVELERWSTEAALLDAEFENIDPGFAGWDSLRLCGGEISEIYALAPGVEPSADAPVLLAGQFVAGGLFQASFVPHQTEHRYRLAAVHSAGRAELLFPQGWPGPATLSYADELGEPRAETWPAYDPWPALVAVFESHLAQRPAATASLTSKTPRLTWHDALRGLELDDAARRAIQRRRATVLEFQEATEEAGFKGTMTLLGCGILWACLALLILSIWVPWMGWLILPVIGLFLALQVLRWVVPPKG